MQTKQAARSRAEVILKVRAGRITAKAAAALLGVSRKTYYQWEKRGLAAMLRELENQKPGRPVKPAPAETALTTKVAQLEAKLKVAEQTAQIRAMLRAMEGATAKKKRKRSRKSSACSTNSKTPPG
jgi:transposase